jgi:plastocyanin
MFGLGLVSSLLTERFTKKLMLVGASLVMLLGLFMFSNGWTLSNLPAVPNPVAAIANFSDNLLPENTPSTGSSSGQTNAVTPGTGPLKPTNSNGKDVAVEKDGVQLVQSTLKSNNYPAIQVAAGTPVRWEIEAPNGSITGCNNRMIIPEYQIQYAFQKGTNVIEFTPEKPGTYRYSCWMGMVSSTITVV